MRLADLCEKIDCEIIQGSMEIDIKDIVYDSRKAEKGCLFVCMVGAETDGHKYIPDALEKGASALVVERSEECREVPKEVAVIKVDSARYALALMSAAYF